MASEYLTGAARDPKPDGGAWTRQPAILVLHSTEGSGWPSYGGTAPHLTIDTSSRQVRQHIPFTRAARALKNKAGGVQTNRAGAIQVELVGTCSHALAQQHGWVYLPDLHDDDLAWLGSVLHEVGEATGVPLTTSVEWRDYADGAKGGSYGAANGLRLGERAWSMYAGVLGHMHVPEQDHGDPGALDVPRLLQYATAVAELPSVAAPAPVVAVSDPAPATPAGHQLGAWPLPPGHWFGVESRDARVHSGYYPGDRPRIRSALDALADRGWRGVPTGDRYTDDVAQLVRAYQADAGLARDGRLGVHTWTSISQSRLR